MRRVVPLVLLALVGLLARPAAAQLDADFTADVTSGGAALTVTFRDSSSGAVPTAWTWDFGDGGFVSGPNDQVTHTYLEPGTYSVSMTALAFPQSDTETKADFIVVVAPDLVPDFDVSPSTGANVLGVLFTDMTSGVGAPAEWLWEFGDGASATGGGAFHFYDTPGTYDVTLTVSAAGQSWSVTQVDAVTVTPADMVPDFSVAPASGTVPLTVDFSNETTGVLPHSYVWDFGDSSGTAEISPSHTYEWPGTYSVTLTAKLGGQSEVVTKTDVIEVLPAPLVPGVGGGPFSGPVPLQVAFEDASTGVAPTQWFWNFGDGSVSVDQNPVHEYALPGDYTVWLKVWYFGQAETTVFADLIHVEHLTTLDVPGDAATIQEAIDLATPFTEIRVAPGTYSEAITLRGVPITVRGTGGAGATVIDATGLGASVVRVPADQPAGTTLRGLTLTRGEGLDGGGVHVADGASLVLRECHVVGNGVAGFGGGLWASASATVLAEDCVFANNHSDSSGGGVFAPDKSLAVELVRCAVVDNDALGWGGGAFGVVAEGCVFRGNLAGGDGGGAAESQVEDCLFEGNAAGGMGGGLVLNAANDFIVVGSVSRCTFRGNSAGVAGGGARITAFLGFSSTAEALDCVFDGNDAPIGDGLSGDALDATVIERCTFLDDDAAGGTWLVVRGSIFTAGGQPAPDNPGGFTATSHSCVVGGWPGNGNIDADPLLVDPAAGAYGLLPGSPCIDTGWPNGGDDPDGSPPDMGALPLAPVLDVGFALQGALGLPALAASGDFSADGAVALEFDRGPAWGVTHLVLGTSGVAQPFKGGILVPAAEVIIPGLPLDAQGALSLSATWPGLPLGASLWLQSWAVDRTAPQDHSATNGLVVLQL